MRLLEFGTVGELEEPLREPGAQILIGQRSILVVSRTREYSSESSFWLCGESGISLRGVEERRKLKSRADGSWNFGARAVSTCGSCLALTGSEVKCIC